MKSQHDVDHRDSARAGRTTVIHDVRGTEVRQTPSRNDAAQALPVSQFPGLAALGMTLEDLALLAQQGFVNGQRQRGKTYFKLHWRRAGQQKVRYIGSAERAAAIRMELESLQRDVQAKRTLGARMRAAKRAIREAKRRLEPVLAGHGYAFHGLAIRRPRPADVFER